MVRMILRFVLAHPLQAIYLFAFLPNKSAPLYLLNFLGHLQKKVDLAFFIALELSFQLANTCPFSSPGRQRE